MLFADEDFAQAFSTRGQPALSPARLALVSILQFTENLSDRKAAEAVRARIDWKYALGLELTDPGFDHSVLCEFRLRLIDNGMGQRSSMLCWNAPVKPAWCAAAAGSAPIPLMFWPPFGR
ncbi:transposase [Nonomuraea polychroma]|uniref:transposase n=1 Tax=Nonomuraea polychroma TaxID=46176 RepID=UPI003D93BFD6